MSPSWRDDRAERAFLDTEWRWAADGLYAFSVLTSTCVETAARFTNDGTRAWQKWIGPEPEAAEKQLAALWDTLAPLLARRVRVLRLPAASLYLRVGRPWRSPHQPHDAVLPILWVKYDPARDRICLVPPPHRSAPVPAVSRGTPLALVTGEYAGTAWDWEDTGRVFLQRMTCVSPVVRHRRGGRVILRVHRTASQRKQDAELASDIDRIIQDARARPDRSAPTTTLADVHTPLTRVKHQVDRLSRGGLR